MTVETRTAGMTVRECVSQIADGTLTSERWVRDCLAVIDASENDVMAWTYLDREQALAQARALDDMRRRGQPLGALHGVPIGVKDIYDTSDMPTEYGSRIFSGRTTPRDATAVEKLREAGAVILGKTVTTEFAFMHPSATRNPHDQAYSPGGSSSGSAAAVGAGQVPLALGSQTNGSVIRPASYCGVYGFKPSRGVVSRRGVLPTSPTLDAVGVFARDPADAALLVDAIKGYDSEDAMSYLAPRPRMLEGFLSDVPVAPNFAWIDMPYADRYSADVRNGFDEISGLLGQQIDRLQAPKSFAALMSCHKRVYEYEISRAFADERATYSDLISPEALSALERGANIAEDDYLEALAIRDAADDWFAEFFNDFDAILTPSAPGPAPLFGDGTGDPVCCTTWTFAGLPCITLPLLASGENLPIGVQLVGALNEDERLMRTTRWLLNRLQTTP